MMRRFMYILVFGCICLSLVQPFIRTHVHYHNLDVAFNYHMATLMTEGQIPYRDFIDFNFPTIWYLSLIPAYISTFTHNDSVVLSLFLSLCTIISATTCSYLISKSNFLSLTEKSLLLITLFFVFSTFQTYDFGQREHLFVLALSPFIFRQYFFTLQKKTPILDAFIGFITITGACIKPYFIFTLLGIETLSLLKQGRLTYSRSMKLGLIIGITFWGTIGMYHAHDYLIIAEYARQTYAGQNTIIGVNPITVILTHQLSLLFYASIFLFIILYKNKDTLFTFHSVWITASTLSFIWALVQMKGFDYHIKIASSFSVISLSIGFIRFFSLYARDTIIKKNAPVLLCTAIVLRQCYTCSSLTESYADNYLPTRMSRHTDELLSKHKNAKTVFKVSTFSQPLYPAIIEHRVRDITGCNTLWYLGSFYRDKDSFASIHPYRSLHAMQTLERHFFNKVIHTITTKKPDIIIVADSNNNFFFSVSGFDINKYYLQDHSYSRMLSENYGVISHAYGHTWYKKRSLQ